MREIKFRAWDKENSKMMNVLSMDLNNEEVLNCTNATESHYDFDTVIVVSVLEQYTGLKDKNGKEIYEGDIIKIKNEYFIIKYNVSKYACYFLSGAFSRDLFDWIIMGYEIKVIGNIHENPELLEDSK